MVSIPQGEIVKEFPLYDGFCSPGSKACEVEVVYWTPDGKYIVAAGNNILPAVVVEYANIRVDSDQRSAFDRLTGDMYIGDVGQSDQEEINFHPSTSPVGENYMYWI